MSKLQTSRKKLEEQTRLQYYTAHCFLRGFDFTCCHHNAFYEGTSCYIFSSDSVVYISPWRIAGISWEPPSPLHASLLQHWHICMVHPKPLLVWMMLLVGELTETNQLKKSEDLVVVQWLQDWWLWSTDMITEAWV